MASAIPIEVYEILEDKLGREDARAITKALEGTANVIAVQKKVEIRDELSKELASKSDLLATESKLGEEITKSKIETKEELVKSRLYFALVALLILMTNPKALELIAKVLGVVK